MNKDINLEEGQLIKKEIQIFVFSQGFPKDFVRLTKGPLDFEKEKILKIFKKLTLTNYIIQ